MSDDSDPEFVVKKACADMDSDEEVYVKADNAEDAKKLFDHARKSDIE